MKGSEVARQDQGDGPEEEDLLSTPRRIPTTHYLFDSTARHIDSVLAESDVAGEVTPHSVRCLTSVSFPLVPLHLSFSVNRLDLEQLERDYMPPKVSGSKPEPATFL